MKLAFKLLTPKCAVCNKEVENMDAFHDIGEPRVLVISYCHGKVEETILKNEMIQNASVLQGVAFKNKKLEGKYAGTDGRKTPANESKITG